MSVVFDDITDRRTDNSRPNESRTHRMDMKHLNKKPCPGKHERALFPLQHDSSK
jgi:hypothetical protein